MKRVLVLTDDEIDLVLGWYEQLAHVDAIGKHDDPDARLRFEADLDEDDEALHAKIEGTRLAA